MKKSKSQKTLPRFLLLIMFLFLSAAFAFPSFSLAQETNVKEVAANYALDSVLGAFSTTLVNIPIADRVMTSSNRKMVGSKKSVSGFPKMKFYPPDFSIISSPDSVDVNLNPNEIIDDPIGNPDAFSIVQVTGDPDFCRSGNDAGAGLNLIPPLDLLAASAADFNRSSIDSSSFVIKVEGSNYLPLIVNDVIDSEKIGIANAG